MSQKTERATPKRRKEAREKGNVLRSADLSMAAILLAVFVCVKSFGGAVVQGASGMMQDSLGSFADSDPLTITGATKAISGAVMSIIKIGAPLVLVGFGVAIAVNVAQTGLLFSTKAMKPQFNRISPKEGFKRIFSGRSLVEMLKAILKVAALGWVAYSDYVGVMARFPNLAVQGVLVAAQELCNMVMDIALKMAFVIVVLAAADFFYQWWRRERDMRMTKQEIKDEMKQTEGDPQTKSRIRSKQRQIGMMRMMHAVPHASVVITNPTHYAIALRYQDGLDAAPVVLAKGKDLVAQRIKEVARNAGVELVENRPLAQALYVYCEVGDSIPKDMYKAVAEVLAYVYRLKHPVRVRERAAT